MEVWWLRGRGGGGREALKKWFSSVCVRVSGRSSERARVCVKSPRCGGT